jgi:hypothetical protein
VLVRSNLQNHGQQVRTVKGNNAEDKDKRQNKDNDGVDLEAGRLISVEPYDGY